VGFSSHRSSWARHRRALAGVVVVSVIVGAGLAACTTQSGGGGGGGGVPPFPYPAEDPSEPVWIAGDSNGFHTADHTAGTYNLSVGGAGFLRLDHVYHRTIAQSTQVALESTGVDPSTIVVIGGVNDLADGWSAEDIVAAVEDFEEQFTDGDTRVVFADEPTWTAFDGQLDAVDADVAALYPDSIDCDEVAEAYPGDQTGFHAFELYREVAYASYWQCILAAL
jgi:hypothetical protein